MNTYEVTDPTARLFLRADRPRETEQDLIVLAMEYYRSDSPGLMFQIKEDHPWAEKDCSLCDGTAAPEMRKYGRDKELRLYEVDWDPSIRL